MPGQTAARSQQCASILPDRRSQQCWLQQQFGLSSDTLVAWLPQEPAWTNGVYAFRRVVDALHLTAPCCTQQQQRPSAGATSAPASSSSAPPTSGLNLQLSTSTPTPGEALALPPLEINAFLTAAHCEAQLVQMLLDSQAASASDSGPAAPAAAVAAVQQSREQHVLDAVVRTNRQGHNKAQPAEQIACMTRPLRAARLLTEPSQSELFRHYAGNKFTCATAGVTLQPNTLCAPAVLPAGQPACQSARLRTRPASERSRKVKHSATVLQAHHQKVF
jgi:hypothetical protein